MSILSHSVPVELAQTWAGLAENSGLLRLDDDALVLEFESKDGVLELLRSGVQQLRVPLKELEALHWRPGWLGGKLELAVRSMSVIDGIPGAAQGVVTFKIARKHRDRAVGLAANVELALAHRVVQSAESSASRLPGASAFR